MNSFVTRPAMGLLVLAVLAACGEDRARVHYAFFDEPGFSRDLLHLEVSDGDRTWRLDGDDFAGQGVGETPEFRTRTSGELETAFWLVEGADTLTFGTVRVDLRPDWGWRISFYRNAGDPSATCFGCFGSEGYELPQALRTAPADSLWIVWGGNSISDPVVY